MPLLRVQTNADLEALDRAASLKQLSADLAQLLGKPESYIMVTLEPVRDMVFAGTSEPTAYLEVKSIGLPEDKTTALSEALCGLIENTLRVPKNRTYIEFADAKRSMWGWDGHTF